MIYRVCILPKEELWELKIWSAFILNLTALSANKIEPLSWLADKHDVIWRQVTWSDKRDRFACVFCRRSVHEKITSCCMIKYGICAVCRNNGGWARSSVFRVQRWRGKEYKLNCACSKIKCMKFQSKVIQSLSGLSQIVSFLLFATSRTRQYTFYPVSLSYYCLVFFYFTVLFSSFDHMAYFEETHKILSLINEFKGSWGTIRRLLKS